MERIRLEWLIFFYTPYNPPFYTRWRKKGFTHVGGLHFCPKFKCWVLLEGLYGRLYVEIIDGNEAQKVLSYVKRLKGTVLKGKELDTPNFRGEWWIKEHSCTSYIQRLIGLRSFWIFTPYQLFCALRKLHFEVFVDSKINTMAKKPKPRPRPKPKPKPKGY